MEAAKDSQTAFRNWFDGYLNTILATASFGGQITFAVIVTDVSDPTTLQPEQPHVFSKETVRLLIALSWFSFVGALGLTTIAKLVYCGPPIAGADDRMLRPSRLIHGILTLVLNGLSVSAFFLLSLAIVAYVPAVGWMGVALLSLYFAVVLWLWLVMNTGLRNSAIAPMAGPYRPQWSVPQRNEGGLLTREQSTSANQAPQQFGSLSRRTA